MRYRTDCTFGRTVIRFSSLASTCRRVPLLRVATSIVVGIACALWVAGLGFDRLTVAEIVWLQPSHGPVTRPSWMMLERERRHPTGAYLAWARVDSFARTMVVGENRSVPLPPADAPVRLDDRELDVLIAAAQPARLPYWSRIGEPNPGVTYQAGDRMLPDYVMREHAVGWPMRMVGLRARGSQTGWTDVFAERAFVGRRRLRWYEIIYWALRWHADQVFVIWPGALVNTTLFALPVFGLLTMARRGLHSVISAARRRLGACEACGYRREGLEAGAPCPECGGVTPCPSRP